VRVTSGPTLLILGHVTRDVFGQETRLGGAASFAARAAALLGIDTALVTVAPRDAVELAPLRSLPGLSVCIVPSDTITTFGLEYTGSERKLGLLARARPLAITDVPEAWRAPMALYVGPVAGECDTALVEAFAGSYVMASIQGWLRDPAARGAVVPAELGAARKPPSNLRAACLSSSDHPRAFDIAARLTSRGVIVALTRGRAGSLVMWDQQSVSVPAEPAQELDPTGAGDVFSLVFGLSLWCGHAPRAAGQRAALAAARVVEGPGLGRLLAVRSELTFAPPVCQRPPAE
jgi:1D-myo-inositol 3-kinase